MKVVTPGSSEESRILAKKYGYDEWLVSRFLAYVPEVEKFMEKMEQPPMRYIRVNTLKASPSELKARLEAKDFALTQTALPEVFSVSHEPMSAGATAEYMLGHYYVQDLSSCIAVDALDAREGHDVLEVAAAPGGKTTMIAQRMNNTGSIVAFEPNPRRARSMSFNLTRCGVINTAIMQSDGRDAGKMGLQFDRVLLDAPCSCEGVIAKDETRKTSHEPSDVEMCSTLQESLIAAAAAAVRPGGILVYSTCSFAPEENEAVLDSLIQKRDDVSVEPIRFGSAGIARFQNIEFSDQVTNARRLYPHLHDTTGFFIAKVRVG